MLVLAVMKIDYLDNLKDSMESKRKELFNILMPSNCKTLLEISLKLYDDEIASYRFLEEKISRILNLVSILIPICSSIFVWIYVTAKVNTNCLSKILSIISISLLLYILFQIYTGLKLNDRHYIIISDQSLDLAKKRNYDNLYIHFQKAVYKAVEHHRTVNNSKAKILNTAYKALGIFFIVFIVNLLSFSYDALIVNDEIEKIFKMGEKMSNEKDNEESLEPDFDTPEAEIGIATEGLTINIPDEVNILDTNTSNSSVLNENKSK